jgi:5-methylcytosine-specific restriction endonuclease McrA
MEGATMTTTTTQRNWTTTGEALMVRRHRLVAFDLCNRRCPVCARRMTMGTDKIAGLTIDHLIAWALLGGGDLGNLIPLCASCNSSKGKRNLVAWLVKRMPAVRATRAKTRAGILRAAAARADALVKLAADLKSAIEALEND